MTDVIAMLIGGGVLVPVLQTLKRAFHIKDNAMRWTACGAAIVTAGAAMLLNGADFLSSPILLMQSAAGMFGVSQVIYGAIKDKMGLSETLSSKK